MPALGAAAASQAFQQIVCIVTHQLIPYFACPMDNRQISL